MNDDLLGSLRQAPPPAFATGLRQRLREQAATGDARSPRPLLRGLMAAAAGIAIVGAFSYPGVRASAQSFLQLFRDVEFVAVAVDPSRLQIGPSDLLGFQMQVDEAPARVTVSSPADAAALAGYDVRMPANVPIAADTTLIEVIPKRSIQVTGDTKRLQQVMDLVGMRDLELPNGLDGQVLSVRVQPAVQVTYKEGVRYAEFVQAPIPEVLVPDGLDLSRLGEIGLRLMGLPPGEARQLALTIDWQSTLVVPVPPAAGRVQTVYISGHRGIAGENKRGSWVMWSDAGRVYAIKGTLLPADVLAMANSLP